MADELLRSKHGFGQSENVEYAKEIGKLDEYDILFLDGDTEPKIGWIDAQGNTVIVDHKDIFVVDELPQSGVEGKLYIVGSAAYIWTNDDFVPLGGNVEGVTEEIVNQIVDQKVAEAKKYTLEEANAYADEAVLKVLNEIEHPCNGPEYEIAYKPVGAIVNYHDKEIRVMCPENITWSLQNSGEGADSNKYYIGFKAYAPEGAVSFKEDTAEIITDETMYTFEGNDFAGVNENGRKYSIVWLPVAVYDSTSKTWTYYGANSTEKKYIGWYYSVEWYNADGVMIASDCIRINLSNEACHSSIKPFYMNSVDTQIEESIEESKAYTDEQIATALSAFTVVEF